jgi:hypothetical protein
VRTERLHARCFLQQEIERHAAIMYEQPSW